MIDLVGLQISTAEFLWTIISFFLFMFLLKKFLYDPILNVMDARAARIQEGLEEGRNAKKALEESKTQLAAELSEKNGEARELISEARSEAEKAKGEVLSAAHAEAEKLHREVRDRVKAEEAEAVSSVENDLPELVAILSNKLLHSDEAGNEATLIKDCIEASKG